MHKRVNQKPWLIFYILLILDCFVILLHLIGGYRYQLFNLDLERNIPTFYQSIKYILVGFLCFANIFLIKLLKNSDKIIATFWTILGIILVYLGLDEIGELHENLDQTITLIIPNIESIFDKFFFSNGYVSSPWILYNLLAIIILSPIIIWIFYTSIKLYQKRNIYLLTTFLCFALVILLEYISTSWVHPIIYNILIVIEEFIEMFGISLLSVFVSIETSQRYTQIKNKLK